MKKNTVKDSPVRAKSTKKSNWNINISIAENGYVIRVERSNNDTWEQKTFIALSEKELAKIIDQYK